MNVAVLTLFVSSMTTEYLFYGNTFFQYDGIPPVIGALTNLGKQQQGSRTNISLKYRLLTRERSLYSRI